MKKILYITANSKDEKDSTCKTVARELVNQFLDEHLEYDLEELDLYSEHIPIITDKLFVARDKLNTLDSPMRLSRSEKQDIKIVEQLVDQFLECDTYVIAAPMWNLFFPAILKTYMDCVIQCEKTVHIAPDDMHGLMDDIERTMIYVQSSGGKFSSLFTSKLNYGVHYLHDMSKFLGIKNFHTLLIENTGFTEEERLTAINSALKDVPKLVKKM